MWSMPTPSSAAAPRWRTACCVRPGLTIVDLIAARREHVPRRAELVESLPRDVSRLRVGGVAVAGMAVVGHLEGAVAALRRPELGPGDAGPGCRLARGRGGRPETGARAVAGARGALVRLEQVERPSLPVHQGRADLQLPEGDRRAGAGSGARVGRRLASGGGGSAIDTLAVALLGVAAAAASAACDDQRRRGGRECEER